MLEMSHIEYLKEIIDQPIEFFRKEARNVAEKRAAATGDKTFRFISELREETIKKNSTSRRVRRVFVESNDQGAYTDIGWVLSVDVDFCMVCQRDFGLFYDPHIHCHACGNIVCKSCANAALVHELRKIGPVPVCKFCDWGQVNNHCTLITVSAVLDLIKFIHTQDTIHIVPSVDNRRAVASVPQRRPKYVGKFVVCTSLHIFVVTGFTAANLC